MCGFVGLILVSVVCEVGKLYINVGVIWLILGLMLMLNSSCNKVL